MDAAKSIQYRSSKPAIDPTDTGSATFASRYLSTRGEDPPTTFTEVFDASDRLAAWSNMQRIDHARVQKTDVVVVECHVKRFRLKDTPDRYSWKTWGVSFELLRIGQLLAGPGPSDFVPDDSNISL
ncbi:hypothetical protein C2E23DRAFT_858971 [Lenzites betulinus]|nr:hypothetical protein C2E23DRAFT_858971 [Lenzites betulinus]